MDDRTGLCVGCLRTIEEIAGWNELADEQRRRVLADLRRRRARLGSAVAASSIPKLVV